MCVIAYKPKGVTLKVGTLKKCWDANPHGAGVMFAEDGKVFGFKGFMTFKALRVFLEEAGFAEDGKLVADDALVIHFRLATHGPKVPENCHPFPVSADEADLTAVSWEADLGVAHNGIIRVKDIPEGRSDTQTYVGRFLSARPGLARFDKRVVERVKRETEGSRLFILKGDGSFRITGKWHRNKQGVLWSNLHWWARAEEKKKEGRKNETADRVGSYPHTGGRVGGACVDHPSLGLRWTNFYPIWR